MGIFNIGKKSNAQILPAAAGGVSNVTVEANRLAELALKTIHDGVLILNKDGVIKYINPAAVEMTGCERPENALNLDFALVMKFEKTDGTRVDENNNTFLTAVKTNQEFDSREFVLISKQADKKTPIALHLTPSGDGRSDRIITFRNIAKELEEEGAQTEFISTASHEMRTPVASIEGYLGLALNPQTATIDARARQYLESAHSASQHLGNLFRDLLDVTKLDDKRIHTHMVPLELTGFVKKFSDEYIPKFKEKNLNYSFGADSMKSKRFAGGGKTIDQVVYTFADVDFLGEIIANLIENAIKYTPEGGAIWVNVQGDGDRALINVTDTGIGIAAEDLQHIFQKFYRADNSQTRTVGGTGLGLYLVKQRVEAMAGRVWAESAFGEGSTFYVSLPRLTSDEFEKRQIAEQNQKAVQSFAEKDLQANVAANAAGTTVLGMPNLNQSEPSFDPSLLGANVAQAPVASVEAATQNTAQTTTPPAPMVIPNSMLAQAQSPVYGQPTTPTVGTAPTLQPTTPQAATSTPIQPAIAQPSVTATQPAASLQTPVSAPATTPAQQPMAQAAATMPPAQSVVPVAQPVMAQPAQPLAQQTQQPPSTQQTPPIQNGQNIIQ
ncbi:PAS domain-containing protein [Candidatus Saccharibacteria bacterium]|nr:PAS domain-containing protein [Candidatus Saccharibacteria bacterium]